MIAHFLAVEPQLIISESRDESSGPNDVPVQLKRLPQLVLTSNSLALPIARGKEPGVKAGNLTEVARIAFAVPPAGFPVVGSITL